MRILQVIDSATVGGAEENTALLARELARRGHAVRLASPEGPYTERFDQLRGDGVTAFRLPLRGSLLAARKALAEELHAHPADLVHSHMLRADAVVALQGRRVRYRRATTLHNMFDKEVTGLRRLAYRALASWAYRRFDAVLPVSQHVAGYLSSYLGIRGEHVQVVPNGIDAESFRARSAQGHDVPGTGAVVLLTVGRLDENKGQEIVLQAAARLAPDLGRPVEVWLVGEGPRRGALEALARDLGVGVRLMGRRTDVPALMQRADVVVQPSRWEALPNTVLEALALARPVVATRAGGTPEAVRHGQTGWLVPVDDAEALAAAVVEAVQRPALAQRLGETGRDLVDRFFTIARAADLLLAHAAVARP